MRLADHIVRGRFNIATIVNSVFRVKYVDSGFIGKVRVTGLPYVGVYSHTLMIRVYDYDTKRYHTLPAKSMVDWIEIE
jgi:hypothetical protein